MHVLVGFAAVAGFVWFVLGRTAARVFVGACAIGLLLIVATVLHSDAETYPCVKIGGVISVAGSCP